MSNEQQRYVRILPSAVESKYEKWSEDEIGGIWQADFYDTFVELDGGLFTIEPHHVQEVYVYDEPRELPTAKPMKVSVVKAGSNHSWYSNMIGKECRVLAEEGEYYKVNLQGPLGGATSYIRKRDCEIVTEPEPDRNSDMEARLARLEAAVDLEIKANRQVISDCMQAFNEFNHKTSSDRIAELEARVKALEEKQEVMVTIGPQTESNIDKARRLYPKGTRFKSAMDGFEHVSNGIINSDGDGCISIGGWYVLYNGQWAEILQDEPADVKTWELTIDIPEWGLKKGQHSEDISNNMAKFSWQDYTASIPLSIMPHIAKAVG